MFRTQLSRATFNQPIRDKINLAFDTMVSLEREQKTKILL